MVGRFIFVLSSYLANKFYCVWGEHIGHSTLYSVSGRKATKSVSNIGYFQQTLLKYSQKLLFALMDIYNLLDFHQNISNLAKSQFQNSFSMNSVFSLEETEYKKVGGGKLPRFAIFRVLIPQ